MKKSYPHNTIFTKKLNKILCCFCLQLVIISMQYSQQFNNWYFPESNGIKFINNTVQYLPNNPMLLQFSCGVMSDNNGNLLFSSDGVKVYDKNNNIMPNGFGLLGDLCAINGLIVVPFLNDTSKYYVFTARGTPNFFSNNQSTLPYSYSIVDMALNGGLGDVVSKNNLIRYYSTEKMTAIPKADGNGIWWICRDWTNHFYSYTIACSGIDTSQYIISTVGENVNNQQSLIAAGDIKASTDGKYIAVSYGFYFEIYQFNRATGILSNAIKIPTLGSYGVEFSPNSKLLYISGNGIPRDGLTYHTYQFNLITYDSATIYNTAVELLPANNTPFYGMTGGLQLGPDNKIYHCNGGQNFIDRIELPNVIGNGCTFTEKYLTMPNQTARRFPYAAPFTFTNPNTQITYTVAADCRTVTLQGKTYLKGNNLTFKWRFGDGDSATQIVASSADTTYTTITHTYPLGQDTFAVSLTVTSDTVCGLGRAGKLVVVKPPPPTANFGYSLTCNNLTVTFTDSSLLNSNPSLSYQYATKPALAPATAYTNFATTPNATYTYPTYDSVDVRLIVTSTLSCVQQNTIVKRLVLKAKPTASSNYTNACGSLVATITNSSSIAAGSITGYQYYLGNALIGTNPSFTYSFATYGNYTIKQLVQSNFGCSSDTFYLPITIRAKPTTTLSLVNDTVCANTAFTLSSNSTITAATIANYNWQVNTGAVVSTTANTNTFNLPTGNYTIRHWVISSQGCSSDTVSQPITVVAYPLAAFTLQNTCTNNNILLQNNSTGNGLTYTWQFGDGTTGTGATPTKAYTVPNTYTIQLRATTANGCADSTTQPITIEPAPTAAFTATDICLGKPITLLNTSTGTITNYTWAFGDGTIGTGNNPIKTYATTGNYTISLTATSQYNCTNTAVQNISVAPVLITTNTADTTLTQNQPLQLQASGGASYSWSPNSNLSSTAVPNPTFTSSTIGTYNLSVMGTTTQGCQGTATVIVRVWSSKDYIWIPTIFTPNGDGVNDVLQITCNGLSNLQRFAIYNRYGQLIHLQTNCNNNSQWNGTYLGKAQPTGTYIYTYQGTTYNGQQITGKGTVVVAR